MNDADDQPAPRAQDSADRPPVERPPRDLATGPEPHRPLLARPSPDDAGARRSLFRR